MTAAVFLIALIAAGVSFSGGVYSYGGYSIYVLAFLATLTTAVCFAVSSREARLLCAALVLVANFLLSHVSWGISDPILAAAVLDLCTAAYFVFLGTQRFEFTIALLMLLSVAVGALTAIGWFPSAGDRAPVFIALSHPDALAVIGHGCSVALGIASGDSGRLARSAMVVNSVVGHLGGRCISGCLSLVKGQAAQKS